MNASPNITLLHRIVLTLAAFLIALRHPIMMLRHRLKLGRWPNAGRPRGHTEKLMWRKLFDRNPLFVTVTDKLAGRSYVAERSPQLPQTRLLWVGTSARDIPDEIMRGPAMVKTTNSSGVNFHVADGKPGREAIARATRHLLGPKGNRRREEWAYWSIRGQLIAEEFVQLGGDGLPTDLKVYVAGNRPCTVWASDKLAGRSLTLAPDGTPLPDPDKEELLPWSERLAELVRDAADLALPIAAEFDMVRVDFLVTPAGLLSGEMTIYSAGGYDRWGSPDVDGEIGAAWDLRNSWFLRQPHRGAMGLYAEALIASEALRPAPRANKRPRF